MSDPNRFTLRLTDVREGHSVYLHRPTQHADWQCLDSSNEPVGISKIASTNRAAELRFALQAANDLVAAENAIAKFTQHYRVEPIHVPESAGGRAASSKDEPAADPVFEGPEVEAAVRRLVQTHIDTGYGWKELPVSFKRRILAFNDPNGDYDGMSSEDCDTITWAWSGETGNKNSIHRQQEHDAHVLSLMEDYAVLSGSKAASPTAPLAGNLK